MGPSPARITWVSARGGSSSRENGASSATQMAHSVSTLGLPVPDSSWDSVDLAIPARALTQVIRAGEGPTVAAAEADYLATLLAACPPGARRDIYRIQAEPGHARESEPHMPGVVEHVVLSTGRALVGVAGEPVELAPGDYIKYPGDVAHVFEALEAGTLAVLLSEHV